MGTEATGLGLVEHWGWAAKKGLMNSNTAGALRAACAQILAIEDGWQDLDVRSIDVDELLHRFENLRKKDFTPKSLAQYGSRFRRALRSYLEYLDKPHGWSFDAREAKGGVGERSKKRSTKPAPQPAEVASSGYMITYPFPVRAGVVARLVLPKDLKSAEARRLSAFLQSLSIEDTKELPSGS